MKEQVEPAKHLAFILKEVVSSYIKHEKDLVVKGEKVGSIVNLTIKCNRADYGQIAGSGGQTFDALQKLFKAIGNQMYQPVTVTLFEPTIGDRKPLTPYEEDKKWNKLKTEKIKDTIHLILKEILTRPFKVMAYDTAQMTSVEMIPSDEEYIRLSEDIHQWIERIVKVIGRVKGRNIHVATVTGQLANENSTI